MVGLIFFYKLYNKVRVCKNINFFLFEYFYMVVDIVFCFFLVYLVFILNFFYFWYCLCRSGVFGVILKVYVIVSFIRYVIFYFGNIWNYMKYCG